ncbi:hypothetical protein Tco_0501028, partial [Tanacetum coccineum]
MPRRSILSFSYFSPATYVAGKKRAGERGFCCSIGGLLQTKCGEDWVVVEAVPGSIVINI